jgi:protocatechuate 3,4-dioxygenase beta subunit
MSTPRDPSSRRHFLRRLAFGTAALTAHDLFVQSLFEGRGAFAEELLRTPRQTEGPFYPDKLPLDTDNDLLIINDTITPAIGEITHLTGRILDLHGNPLRNAVVEIWQCDQNGAYLHKDSDQREKRDGNFQGYGRFLTGLDGSYYFRTIKPVLYPGRAPHIHVIVKKGEDRLLTTQLYIKGEKRNEEDGPWRSIREAKERDLVTIDFAKIEDSKIGELRANADIIVGLTPEDPTGDRFRGAGRRESGPAPARPTRREL